MGYHHLAFASRDMSATHRFYATGEHDGSENAGALIAFWELHDERMAGKDTAISTGLGFEAWVNHVTFAADGLGDIDCRRSQWLDAGIDVMEVDHGFCTSIYTMDPNGILVELCTDTAPYSPDDKDRALEILWTDDPELEAPPTPVFHSAADRAARVEVAEPVTAAAGTPTT